MHIFNVVLTVICIQSMQAEKFKMTNKFRERLSKAERNAICCAKHMRCCKHPANPPTIEIRAVLVRCPNTQCNEGVVSRTMKQPVTYPREHDIKNFQGFDEDEPLTQSDVTLCHKKLIITMKIKNCGFTNCKSEFVVVDHVYDPLTEKKVRLLNPYVIKIKQESITQMYKLKFQHVVNSEAKEVIYNKHDGNYTGCDTSSVHPTCGIVKYKGKIIPYSTGFCCSCDALKNSQRQPESPISIGPAISYSDPAFLLDGVECPRNLGGMETDQQNILPIKTTEEAPDTFPALEVTPLSQKPNHKTSSKLPKKYVNKFEQPGELSSPHLNSFSGSNLPQTAQDHSLNVPGDSVLPENVNITVLTQGLNDTHIYVPGLETFGNQMPGNNDTGAFSSKFFDQQRDAFSNKENFDNSESYFGNPMRSNDFISDINQPALEDKSSEYGGSLLQETSNINNQFDVKNRAVKASRNNLNKKYSEMHYRQKRQIPEDEDMEGNKFDNKEINFQQKVEQLDDMMRYQFESDKGTNDWNTLEKRQVTSSGNQRRGGQNCADRYTPPKLNPQKYHESTHCLRFSDLWYTVYQLQEPFLEHAVLIQIFEKHEDEDGRTRWRDLTRGKMARLGTFSPHFIDQARSISVYYKAKNLKPEEGQYALNYKTARLLVPEGVQKVDKDKCPEIRGGPEEYLVVHPNQISFEGDQCNVAGVGFEAFFKQPNRCAVPRGSCLANQPRNLWKHDHEAEKRDKKGCFFLKHYGSLPKVPIRRNKTGGDQYLAMDYFGKHNSVLDMEVKADFNTVLRPQSSAKITEVYIDSTSPTKTHLTIKVTNAGLTSSNFSTALNDCPLDMPAAMNNIKSKFALIPPQHQHIFHLQIKFSLPVDRFHCSIEVHNCKRELVALRRIRIQKSDRCICTWHCLCACLGSVEGLQCRPMSLEHYHAAGFQGSLPITTTSVEYTFLDDMLSLMYYIWVFILLTLLIMGLTKALIGCCCCPLVGIWGLDVLLDLPKKIRSYYELDIKSREVEYSDDGWPVHPDTKKKVRNISKSTEFCMNLMFFFTYPLAIFCLVVRRLCCPYYTYEQDADCDCYDETHKVQLSRVCKEKSGDVWGEVKRRRLCMASDASGSEEPISFESSGSSGGHTNKESV